MHLGWHVHVEDRKYEVRARKHGPYYQVILHPILGNTGPEIIVGLIMKSYNEAWFMLGDGTYNTVQGMFNGRYAAFHLLKVTGYMGWDKSC